MACPDKKRSPREKAIRGIFLRRSEDGALVHSDREIEDVIAFVLMAMGDVLNAAELSAATQEMLHRFAERAGVLADHTPAEITAALQSYFDKNPLNRALTLELEGVLRELLFENTASARDQLARLIGGTAVMRAPMVGAATNGRRP